MELSSKRTKDENEVLYLWHLLEKVFEDPFIRERFNGLLQMLPCERRLILSNWIIMYWMKKTGPEIIQALAYLFDDKLAEETLRKLNKQCLSSEKWKGD